MLALWSCGRRRSVVQAQRQIHRAFAGSAPPLTHLVTRVMLIRHYPCRGNRRCQAFYFGIKPEITEKQGASRGESAPDVAPSATERVSAEHRAQVSPDPPPD